MRQRTVSPFRAVERPAGLKSGLTTVRDGGDRQYLSLTLRDFINSGCLAGSMSCDAQAMDWGEDVFDLIYSRFGVRFFEDVRAAFTNLHRALKPTGRLLCLAWRGREANPWIHQPVAAMQEIFPPPPSSSPDIPGPNVPGPFSLPQSERLHPALQAAGFTDEVETLDGCMPMGSVDTDVAARS
ncbi:hypothetical protein NKDENANG_01329 [Candidatus Entotheonellaceae bacterium PAL068K]